MVCCNRKSLCTFLALLVGVVNGPALVAAGEQKPGKHSPVDQPFEEDTESETRNEVEFDDESTLMFDVPTVAPTLVSVDCLSEDRCGPVEAATHELHGPRAPPAARV